jgi:hypothetical protein
MMIDLKERKISAKKSIPGLLIAASSLDNIISISGFTTMIDITFSQGLIIINSTFC